MAQSIVVDGIALLLLLSAVAHICLPQSTDSWLSRPSIIRLIGGILLLLALVCLLWHGWYFRTLSAALAVSGAWRLCFPLHSIHTQRRLYPRWVHGCLMLAGAVAVWVLRP